MSRHSLLRTVTPSVLLTLLGFALAYQFVDPAPPRHLTLATGGEQGAYQLFANRYRAILAREGIDLELRLTAGSVENLGLLRDSGRPIDAALIQGGTSGDGDKQHLLSLGSLYFEPMWVFYRGAERLTRLPQLSGRRIAIGAAGSGTQALARQLLAANHIEESSTPQLPLNDEEARDRLLAGTIDAAFMVASPRAPVIRQLLSEDGIQVMSFERADAYTRLMRSLSSVVLPKGAIDLAKDIPQQDTVLLAPAANLVVRADLHPALIDLLLVAAQEVHGEGGWFERAGEFPSADYLEFPISPDARRFYKYGPPFLQRFLPFWAASLIDRTKVMLLPLVALLIPLLKVMPPLYRWRMRSRVYRWYRQLQDIDLGLFVSGNDSLEEYRNNLDRIEHEVAKVDVPLSFADELFNLRLHIELIRQRLNQKAKSS